MNTIRVNRFYEVPEKNSFVLVGEVKGSIGPGDYLRVPVNDEGHRMNFQIDQIVAEQDEPDFEIHIRGLPSLTKILREVQLLGETFEIEDFRE